jgi:hypothetical protein
MYGLGMGCGWLVDSLCASHIVNSKVLDIPKSVEPIP